MTKDPKGRKLYGFEKKEIAHEVGLRKVRKKKKGGPEILEKNFLRKDSKNIKKKRRNTRRKG